MTTSRTARRAAVAAALALAVPAAPALAVPADLHASEHHDSAVLRSDTFGPAAPTGGDGAPWVVFGIGIGAALAAGHGVGARRSVRRSRRVTRAARAV